MNWTTVGPENEVFIGVESPASWGSTSGNFTAGGIVNGLLEFNNQNNGSVSWTEDVILVPATMLSGTLDINAIFKALIALGDLNANEQVSDIRFGSEVSGGAGSLTVNNFSVDWQNIATSPTVSPSGTVVLNNSGGTITDSAYNLWTLVNGIVDENGQPAGSTANVTEIAYVTGLVYQETSGHWYDWTGSAWASTSDPFTTTHHH